MSSRQPRSASMILAAIFLSREVGPVSASSMRMTTSERSMLFSVRRLLNQSTAPRLRVSFWTPAVSMS